MSDGLRAEIDAERLRQHSMWGNSFDDHNTANDWATYIARYATDAAFGEPGCRWREQMVKVAALAVAAIEAFERNGCSLPPRHYDG